MGCIWLISTPYLMDKYYIEENALDANREYGGNIIDGTMKFLFENLQGFSDIQKSSRVYKIYEVAKEKLKLETHLHNFVHEQSGYESTNLLTYYRSKRGYGNECNLFAFPIDHEPSI
jgi:hypothetical protein